MSYNIFGRAIKNEHLALGVLLTTLGVAVSATRGGKSDVKVPTSVQQAKASVPIAAGSSEEEQLIASIKSFVEEAEKSEAKH